MRILLVADIHANWPALQAIDEPHDLCFCLGDLVDYCLDPAPCLDWVRRRAHYGVRGNHDHGVAQNVVVTGRAGFKYLSGVTRVLTQQRLGEDDLRFLGNLPVTQFVTVDETRFLLVHASPRDPLDEYAYPDVEFWTRRLQNVEPHYNRRGRAALPQVVFGNSQQGIQADPVGAKVTVEGSGRNLAKDCAVRQEKHVRHCCALVADRRLQTEAGAQRKVRAAR